MKFLNDGSTFKVLYRKIRISISIWRLLFFFEWGCLWNLKFQLCIQNGQERFFGHHLRRVDLMLVYHIWNIGQSLNYFLRLHYIWIELFTRDKEFRKVCHLVLLFNRVSRKNSCWYFTLQISQSFLIRNKLVLTSSIACKSYGCLAAAFKIQINAITEVGKAHLLFWFWE